MAKCNATMSMLKEDSHDQQVSRRTILKAGVGTSAAWAVSAAGYAGSRGQRPHRHRADRLRRPRRQGHMAGIAPYAKQQNIEVTAVCDPCGCARKSRPPQPTRHTGGRRGNSPRFATSCLKDIDAVMIASPDVHHTMHLEGGRRWRAKTSTARSRWRWTSTSSRMPVTRSGRRISSSRSGPVAQPAEFHRLPRVVQDGFSGG